MKPNIDHLTDLLCDFMEDQGFDILEIENGPTVVMLHQDDDEARWELSLERRDA